MNKRRIALFAATGALAAAGAGVAVGASGSDEAKKAEQAVLSDAAKRLDVTPEKLKDALGAALDAQLDQAVKDGKLTQAQADEMKKRRAERGTILPFGQRGGPGHGRGHGGPGGPGGRFGLHADVAKALGITPAELHTQLHAGKTLAAIAKAEGKTLAEVKAAVKASATGRIKKAVADKEITQAQADRAVEHLDEHLENLGERRRHGGPGHGPGPDGGGNRNGSDEVGPPPPGVWG